MIGRGGLRLLALALPACIPLASPLPAAGVSASSAWTLELRALGEGELGARQPISLGSFDGRTRLDASDARPALAPGLRLRLERRGRAGRRWWFQAGLVDWSGRASVTSPQAELDPVFGPSGDHPTDDFDFAWRHELSRSARLRRFALGLSRDRGAFQWTLALRLRVDDSRLLLRSHDAPPDEPPGSPRTGLGELHLIAEDRRAGIAAALRRSGRLAGSWSWAAQAGVELSLVRSSARTRLENGGELLLDGRRQRTAAGWSAELEALASRELSGRCSLQLGWRLELVGGYTGASELVPRGADAAEFQREGGDARRLRHGPFVGLSVRFGSKARARIGRRVGTPTQAP